MTQDFTGFGLPAKLLQALARMQFKTPTPIQKDAIPLALAGHDILGSAQTGTGKTGAFGIPLIAKLMEHPSAQALVMTPTRELAAQVMAAMQQMIPVPDIKTALLIGGEAMPRQFRQLDRNPRLIVGTPGRITDHLMRGSLKLAQARFLVLDETDRMLDMGFGPQIDKIMEYMPGERQTLMFSATLPENIIRMSRKYLKEPKRISVGSTHTAHVNIKQELIKMGEGEKYQHLLQQLGQRTGSVIVFADKLNKDQHKSDAIHGDLHQRRRDRVIQGFRDKRYRVLVATDVAARGLDIPHIEHVINYDLPQCPEDYIHRIGRTARAGAEGSAINFLTSADHNKWNAIYRLMNPGAPRQQEGRREGGKPDAANKNRNFQKRKRWGRGRHHETGHNPHRPDVRRKG
jgi:ATP-dependent RNA helicase DeaD